MKKLTLFIENGEKTVYFDESIMVTRGRPQIMLKKATVYWDYNNVVKGLNDVVAFGGRRALVGEGYRGFEALEELVQGVTRSHGGVVTFEKSVHDGTCRILASKDLKLGKMELLLGFGEDDVILGGKAWTSSPDKVDINRGLRYVEILCDAVESGESLYNGRRSELVCTLPISSDQTLKGSVQRYVDVESRVGIQKGVYNNLTFKVRGNNGGKVGAVLLELYIG